MGGSAGNRPKRIGAAGGMSDDGRQGSDLGAPAPWEPCASLPPVTITDVKTICTAPDGIRLVVVKVETSEPGSTASAARPSRSARSRSSRRSSSTSSRSSIGRDPDDIEDIWQASFVSSYWRSGPVLNNAMSGVDKALWDIKGKRAGMPVYQLLGGKCRRAADVYVHANGQDLDEVEDSVSRVRASRASATSAARSPCPATPPTGTAATSRRRAKGAQPTPS